MLITLAVEQMQLSSQAIFAEACKPFNKMYAIWLPIDNELISKRKYGKIVGRPESSVKFVIISERSRTREKQSTNAAHDKEQNISSHKYKDK